MYDKSNNEESSAGIENEYDEEYNNYNQYNDQND